MNGPGHYRRAEELLEHAGQLLAANVAPEDRAELAARRADAASMAVAHALLAAAAVAGLSAPLDAAEAKAWRDVAGTPVMDPKSGPQRRPG